MNCSRIKDPILHVLSNPRVLGPAVFVSVGTAKTFKDYHRVPEDKKRKVLVKDSAVLLSSLAAFAAVSPFTKKFCNTKIINFFVKKMNKLVLRSKNAEKVKNNNILIHTKNIAEKTEKIAKDAIAGTINTFASIIGAVYSNELLHKYVFPKPYFQKKTNADSENIKEKTTSIESEHKSVFKNFINVNNQVTKDTAGLVLSTLTFVPDMRMLEKPMMALSGFSVVDTKGYHNKLKKVTYELLANTLIPTIFVSAMSIFVQNKKPAVKYPALFLALMTGAFVGNATAERVKDKLYKTIDAIDLKHIVV